MHFKTVKDVVDHSRQLHHQISQFYHKLSEDSSKARVSMLLEYLKRHEDHLENTLSQFAQDKTQSVLDSWFQYAPDQDLGDVMSHLEVSDHMDTDDVVSMALTLDDYFIDLYQGMVSNASSSAVKAVFQNLLDMEQHDKIQISKTALQINDM